jgi:hypothetical protein
LSREHDGRITVRPGADGEIAGIGDRIRFHRGPHAGDRAPDARGRSATSGLPIRLFDQFGGTQFTLLLFDGQVPTAAGYHRLTDTARQVRDMFGDGIRPGLVVPIERAPNGVDARSMFLDPDGEAHTLYGAAAESLFLVRPDGYVGFRSQPAATSALLDYLHTLFAADPAPAHHP